MRPTTTIAPAPIAIHPHMGKPPSSDSSFASAAGESVLLDFEGAVESSSPGSLDVESSSPVAESSDAEESDSALMPLLTIL